MSNSHERYLWQAAEVSTVYSNGDYCVKRLKMPVDTLDQASPNTTPQYAYTWLVTNPKGFPID